MKKKIHIDGIIISLYDLPLISNNNIIGDFENSHYNIACVVSPCSCKNHRQFNIALCLQSCFNLKACFRHFSYAVWMLDGFLLYFEIKMKRSWWMMKRLNQILNVIMGAFIGVFIGQSLYKIWHFKTHTEMYLSQSAHWYTSILVSGAFTIAVILIVAIVKLIIREK